MSPTQLTIHEQVTLQEQGKLSATELVTAYLKQIENVNPKINAVVVLKAEQALTDAKHCDAARSKGQSLGPLHGIPFTLKDIFNTKGDCVSAGCLGLKDNIAQDNAIVAERLIAAGGILLGKTNTAELECSSECSNLLYGETLTPYNLDYSSGGSSGGSAAIVAAGGSAFDVGNDTGGSLRVPASHCGVATIRPTVGRVPTSRLVYGQRQGHFAQIATEGPVAKTIEDVALILKIIAGPDGEDPKTVPVPLRDYTQVPLKQLRVAVASELPEVRAHADVQQAVNIAAEALLKAGAVECKPPIALLTKGYELFKNVFGSHLSESLRGMIDALKIPQTSPAFAGLIERLEPYKCDLQTFLQRWTEWDQYKSDFLKYMQDVDILLCPGMRTPGIRKEQRHLGCRQD